MKTLDVSAKIGKEGQPGYVAPMTIKFALGETVNELVEQYGADVIYNHAKSSIIVALQGYMRTKMDPEREEGPMNQEALQADISGDGTEENPGWKPGVRSPGKTAAEKVREQFSKMDPEMRKLLLAELAKGASGPVTPEESEDENGDGVEEAEEEPAPPPPPAQQRGARRR